jgi:hypothetical protein
MYGNTGVVCMDCGDKRLDTSELAQEIFSKSR